LIREYTLIYFILYTQQKYCDYFYIFPIYVLVINHYKLNGNQNSDINCMPFACVNKPSLLSRSSRSNFT